MASEDSLVKLYLAIGETERHFNTIQSNYRLLASTWTLACLGGIGFVLTSQGINIKIERQLICLGIALSGSLSILLLWLVDIHVYQQLLSMSYNEGRVMETVLPWLPQVRHQTRRTFKGRLSRAISLYYVLMFSFLCVIAIVFIFLSDEIEKSSIGAWRWALIVDILWVIGVSSVLWNVRPEKRTLGKFVEDAHSEKKRIEEYAEAIAVARAAARRASVASMPRK